MLISSRVSKPYVIAHINKEKGKRSLFIAKRTIRTIHQSVLVEHNGFLRRWVSRILSHVSSPQAVDVKDCIVVTVFCLIDELFKRILVKLANLKQCSIFIDFFHVLMVLITYLFDTVCPCAPFDLPMLR